jgi:hypothetical protein
MQAKQENLSLTVMADGCRGGILAAIRRGDLDLAKTCFDLLWKEPELAGQAWIRWAIPAFICDEVLPLVVRIPDHMDAIKQARGSQEEERAWRKLIYLATLLPKSRDAMILACFAWHDSITIRHREISAARQFRSEALDNMSVATHALYDKVKAESDEALGRVYNFMLGRATTGGMMASRIAIATAMLLLHERKAKAAVINEQIDKVVKARTAKFGRKPKKVVLPWWVFGPETRIGGRVLSILIKDYKDQFPWQRDVLAHLWRRFEWWHVPESLMLGEPASKPLSVWNNLWKDLPFHDLAGLVPGEDPETVLGTWQTAIRPIVEQEVLKQTEAL